jgi:hypothetical protein
MNHQLWGRSIHWKWIKRRDSESVDWTTQIVKLLIFEIGHGGLDKMAERDAEYPPAICPNCGSTEVLPVDSSDTMLKCKRCGFEGERDIFWTRSDE